VETGIEQEPGSGPSGWNVVLVEPEIPPNTGSVARLCAGCGGVLHLVEPLGFSLDDRYLKRAGLDYWDAVRLCVHPSFAAYLEAAQPDRLWLYGARAPRLYSAVSYQPGDHLVFGSESKGLPTSLLEQFAAQTLRLPILPAVRSYNLANSVAIALFEAIRQQGWDPGPHPGGYLPGKPTVPWRHRRGNAERG
jgi:tRNA (cytidine/uridine-2'-O-)-methyltransferase